MAAMPSCSAGYQRRVVIRMSPGRKAGVPVQESTRKSLEKGENMTRISFLFLAVLTCLVCVSLLHAQGEFITFDAPGAGTGPGQGTLRQQITAAGTIVGNYVDSNYVTHGFVRSAQGAFASIDAPGALRTQALGITQARVVGFYRDTNRVRHGYVLGP